MGAVDGAVIQSVALIQLIVAPRGWQVAKCMACSPGHKVSRNCIGPTIRKLGAGLAR